MDIEQEIRKNKLKDYRADSYKKLIKKLIGSS